MYKTEVQKARDGLIAQGKHPSVDAVRVALGNTGSKSTIHRYLKELEAESSTAPTTEIVISDSLRSLVGQLSKRLAEEADTRITEIQARCDASVQKAAEALASQEREGRALGDQLQRTETALQEATRLYQDTVGQLQDRTALVRALEERVVGLEARLAEQMTHVQSLEQKHQQAREALEHFRQSAKEQRETESRRHEHQVQGLQVELRQAQEWINGKNQELLQLNRDNARLTELHGQSDLALRTLRREHEQLTRVAKAVPGLERQVEGLGLQVVQITLQRDQLRDELDRSIVDLSAERDARTVEVEERRRGETRLQAIEALLAQLAPQRSSEEKP
ncbi:DNA-binding protein [Dyella sp. ASV21]|uniref:DNA-binding protein n=1 Tax=Dyella sp. ASV21 TaxID=2795114 RepID=UPI0018EB3329|nr:DNA-binding protein [Dyella sp. ASV21]